MKYPKEYMGLIVPTLKPCEVFCEKDYERGSGCYGKSICNKIKCNDCIMGYKYRVQYKQFYNEYVLTNQPPKLEDLESGCLVVYRNGYVRVTFKDLKVLINPLIENKQSPYFRDTLETPYCSYRYFDDNLKNEANNGNYNIMKIHSPQGDLIWERKPEVKEVTVELCDGVKVTGNKDKLKAYAEKLANACE